MNELRVRISQDVRFVSKEEGAVLLQLDRGRYQSLNRAGVGIWREIGSGVTAEEIVCRLCARHPDVPRERIARDVAEFLTQLASRGLVTLEGTPR